MKKWYRHTCLLASVLTGLVVAATNADDKRTDAELERLTTLLEAQQKELSELRQQVSATQQADADAMRTAKMREEIRAILKESDFQNMLMQSSMTAGYDNGFYIRSSDNKFSIKFNGLMQTRYTYYETRERNRNLAPTTKRDDRSGFELTRVRFALSGNAGMKELTYWLQIKSEAATNYDTVLDSAWINYAFSDEFQVRTGMFSLKSTGTSLQTGTSQFVDDGVFDAVYNLGTGIGVELWGSCANKRVDWSFQVVNGTSDGGNTNGGRVITPDPAEIDGNIAIVARSTWHVLGEKPGTHFLYESDIDHLSTPAWDIGVHYAFNDDNFDGPGDTRIPTRRQRPYGIEGGFGLVNTNGLQFHQLGMDSGFKWMGFSAYAEYVIRLVDVRRATFDNGPLAPWFLASGDSATTAQHGANVQVGWMLPIPGWEKKLEAVARVGGISALAGDAEGTWEYGAGMNYFIDGDRVKLQGDVIKVSEVPTTSNYHSLAEVNDDALVFRLQLSLAF